MLIWTNYCAIYLASHRLCKDSRYNRLMCIKNQAIHFYTGFLYKEQILHRLKVEESLSASQVL